MRTLILSYLVSVVLIISASLPSIMAAPLEVIPRVSIYLGIPVAFLLSIVLLGINHLMGGSRVNTVSNSGMQSVQIVEKKVA